MRRMSSVAVAAMLMMGAARVEAQLPTVQQVYDKFATAVGGRDAWAKVQGRSDRGTASLSFAPLSGSYERHTMLPNKFRMILDFGMVRIEQGFDGTVGWAAQAGEVQRMPPEQEKSMAEPSENGASYLDPSRYAKAAVEAKETIDGIECYKLAITTKTGQELTEYFDASTGLRYATVVKGPMGEQKSTYKDYKDFEGKKVYTTMTQATPQGDVIMTITSVSFTPADAAMFTAPESIRK
jgi:hypothetical protein